MAQIFSVTANLLVNSITFSIFVNIVSPFQDSNLNFKISSRAFFPFELKELLRNQPLVSEAGGFFFLVRYDVSLFIRSEFYV